MAMIPEFLLRKLVKSGSLKASENGFTIDIVNTFAPAMVIGFGLEVNQQPVPPEQIFLQAEGNSAYLASEITSQKTFPLGLGKTIHLKVTGLNQKPERLKFYVDTLEVGLLDFSVDLKAEEAGAAGAVTTENSAVLNSLLRDAHRPVYHFLPEANWMNDPNGLIEWNGTYHMFYQHNPNASIWGSMHWGHARSKDLVHWEHLPIAMQPDPGADKDGCFSGCAVNDQGVPTLIYTGVSPEVQCIATAVMAGLPGREDLIYWQKYPLNPVITAPPAGLEVTGFRDPCVWKEGENWYLVLGSGIRDVGGCILLYRSKNLRDWEYLHPALTGNKEETGIMWECPAFFPLGDRWVLIFSAILPVAEKDGQPPSARAVVLYFSGEFKDGVFTPLIPVQRLDYYEDVFYAPQTFLDSRGRRLMFGWLREARSPESHSKVGWAGVMSLPLELNLSPDGRLIITPISELESLRGELLFSLNQKRRFRLGNIFSSPSDKLAEGETTLNNHEDQQGCSNFMLNLDVSPGSAETFGVTLKCGEQEFTSLYYDVKSQSLILDTLNSSLDPQTQKAVKTCTLPLASDDRLKLQLYLDHSVLEIYACGVRKSNNDWVMMSTRLYPTQAQNLGGTCSEVKWFVRGGKTSVLACDLWKWGNSVSSH